MSGDSPRPNRREADVERDLGVSHRDVISTEVDIPEYPHQRERIAEVVAVKTAMGDRANINCVINGVVRSLIIFLSHTRENGDLVALVGNLRVEIAEMIINATDNVGRELARDDEDAHGDRVTS